MINICVQKSNNKLINNIIDCSTDSYKFTILDIQNDIYRKYFTYKFDTYLVATKHLNDEILQFINDFHNDVKFIIYHNNINSYSFPNTCQHIIDHDLNINTDNVIRLPKYIINSRLYTNLSIPNKQSDIIFFLDDNPIPSEIESKLYPNSNKRIKLFNNANISNCHNLGTLSELDKRDVLLQSEYYVCENDNYKIEAVLCGCKILDMLTLDTDNPLIIDINKIEYTSYQTFFAGIFV